MQFQSLLTKSRKEPVLEDAGKFLLLFAVFASLAYLFLSSTGALLNEIAAQSSKQVLGFLGVAVEVVEGGDGFPHLVGGGFDAAITDLCSGAVELSVLFGIVMATRDRPVKSRLLGFFPGVITYLVFNPFRIALTLKLAGSWALPLVHDVLFRASIAALLVGYYAAWYSLSGRRR